MNADAEPELPTHDTGGDEARSEEELAQDETLWVRAMVARNLKAAIKQSGWNVETTALKAGIARSMLYSLLSLKHAATTDLLTKLARALDIELVSLFEEE